MSALAVTELAPASGPAESRGRARDDVALLVATRGDHGLVAARFGDLPRFMRAGDLLVVNVSATLPAALAATLDGRPVRVHLSAPLADERWVVELRTADRRPLAPPPVGTRLPLAGGGLVSVRGRFATSERLSVAELRLPGGPAAYLARHGAPIRYPGRDDGWPLDAYQTVFARVPGSAEMASAARPFSHELVTELVTRGVVLAPITLHAGVSSLERDERPYPERYEVPATTARLVNAARASGGRVIAVGTTVVRALETVAAEDGEVAPGTGWTDVIVAPERGLRAVNGLITGWHEPRSSHLLMLEAVAGPDLVRRSYERAGELGFRGHEFGDAHLILP